MVPVGVFSYANANVLGTLQRFTSKLQLHQWHDRCVDVQVRACLHLLPSFWLRVNTGHCACTEHTGAQKFRANARVAWPLAGSARAFASALFGPAWRLCSHPACADMQWTDPWVAGSSPRRRLTQSLGASVNRANENALFRLADDGPPAAPSAEPSPRPASGDTGGGGEAGAGGAGGGGGGGDVLVERCTVTAERSAALTESAYGTAGAHRM